MMRFPAAWMLVGCLLCGLPGCSKPAASVPPADSTPATIQTSANPAKVETGAVAKTTNDLKDMIDFSGHFKPEMLTDEFSKQPIEVAGEIRALDPKGAYDFPRLSLASSD